MKMRNFKITKEQYDMALEEGITLKADVAGANGDVKKAIENSKQQAVKNGINLDNATIAIDAKDTNESKVITIKELKKHYLSEDKKRNSILINEKDFITKYNIK